MSKEQTKLFKNESYRYVSSYLNDNFDKHYLLNKPEILNGNIKTILDVGCGNGQPLLSLCKNLNASGIGVEPSDDAINLLNTNIVNRKVTFQVASAHSLPFKSDQFDLVTTWSVLHWVGRNEYLQALGELIRVTKKILVVMDFVGIKNYRVPYHHDERLFTYKMDFEDIIIGSGIMKKVLQERFYTPPGTAEVNMITESDLNKFEGNYLNYHARKMVIFRKDHNLLPIYQESFFK